MASPLPLAMRTLAAALVLLAQSAAWAGPAPIETVELASGEAVTLAFEADIGTALIADPETADVEVLNLRKVFVLGRAPNVTSLKVYDTEGNLLGAYAVRVNAQREHAQTVVDRIAGAESTIQVDAVGNALFVSGRATSPSEAERVLRGIRAVAGDRPVVDALSLEAQVQVNLEVVISEVSRNITQELGINWGVDVNPFVDPLRTLVTGLRLATGPLRVQPTYEQTLQFQTVQPDGTVSSQSGISTQELGVVLPSRGGDGRLVLSHYEPFDSSQYRVTTFLEALAQNGLAVVHARPNLTVVSGESAQFNSGPRDPCAHGHAVWLDRHRVP